MNQFSEEEEKQLRENFIVKYCAEKGWDRNNLDAEKLLEITSKPEYKTPGMLKS